jgi:hypothetical protein
MFESSWVIGIIEIIEVMGDISDYGYGGYK